MRLIVSSSGSLASISHIEIVDRLTPNALANLSCVIFRDCLKSFIICKTCHPLCLYNKPIKLTFQENEKIFAKNIGKGDENMGFKSKRRSALLTQEEAAEHLGVGKRYPCGK